MYLGKSFGGRAANGLRKSKPAWELLIYEYPMFADEHIDPIG